MHISYTYDNTVRVILVREMHASFNTTDLLKEEKIRLPMHTYVHNIVYVCSGTIFMLVYVE